MGKEVGCRDVSSTMSTQNATAKVVKDLPSQS